jgi:glycosyltransferase involved in cell wall biosynthesis
MRIGIVPNLNSLDGGVYQYSVTMLRALREWGSPNGDEWTVFTQDGTSHPAVADLESARWTVKPLLPPTLRRQLSTAVKRAAGDAAYGTARRWLASRGRRLSLQPARESSNVAVVKRRPELQRWFSRQGMELMLYSTTNSLSFESRIPYVMPIHDVQHRLQPEFPEVSANGEWEWREYLFRNGTRYATLIIADSEVSREDILNLYGQYGLTPDRVKTLPFLPSYYPGANGMESEQRRVSDTYDLPERYLFYPAQFWPHKNHARLVQALALLQQEHGLKIPLVFSGFYAGEIRETTYTYVMKLAHQLGVQDQIHYIGYVPDEDMPGLYAGAVALVMPTFFGPTNIPTLEAWAFNCPVLTSDVRGIREQCGDAAILIDPLSVEAIADGIHRLWTDAEVRRTLAQRGQERLAAYSPHDYCRRLADILNEAKALASSGKSWPGTGSNEKSPRDIVYAEP